MNTATTITFWTWVPGHPEGDRPLREGQVPEDQGQARQHHGRRAALPEAPQRAEGRQGHPRRRADGVPEHLVVHADEEPREPRPPTARPTRRASTSTGCGSRSRTTTACGASRRTPAPSASCTARTSSTRRGITAPPKTWAEFAKAAAGDQVEDRLVHHEPPDLGRRRTGTASSGRPARSRSRSTARRRSASTSTPPRRRRSSTSGRTSITKELVATDADFTDELYQGLSRGKYASWNVAAWGPIFLQGTAKNTSGKWRAATIPQWNAGENVSGNWGGSTDAVMEALAEQDRRLRVREVAQHRHASRRSSSRTSSSCSRRPRRRSQDPDFTDQKLGVLRRPAGQQVLRRRLATPSTRTSSGCRSWTT